MIDSQRSAMRKTLAGLFGLPSWHLQKFHKRDPKTWVFGSWDGLRYSDNSRALFEYVVQHNPEISSWWCTRSQEIYDVLQKRGLPVLLMCSQEGILTMKNAGYAFFSKGPDDVDPKYLNGAYLINLWHGMPLKQVGADAMAFIRPNTLWKKTKTAIRRWLVPQEFLHFQTLSLGSFHTPHLMSAFESPREDILEFGLPRNDKFFQDTQEQYIRLIDEKFDHPTKVLYLPTHRDACIQAGKAFNPFEDENFDFQSLNEVLERRNIVLIYKGHFYDMASKGFSSDRIWMVSDDDYDDLYTFIKDVDILLTDYSSIYFDFLLCRKPIILFPFDLQSYVAYSRPFYFDYDELEAVKCHTWKELADCLDYQTYRVPSHDEIMKFVNCPDGNACERLVKYLLERMTR